MTFPCPLCLSPAATPYHADKRRRYFQCQECLLVFVDPHTLPSIQCEKQEYDLHINDLKDAGYRRFLNKLCDPLCALLPTHANGLDFGSGPGPLLAEMLKERGYSCAVYDPIYAPDESALAKHYDFVSCTEVVEHFHHPYKEWQLLCQLLSENGLLAIMTKRVIDQSRFATWHYINDPTHVSFYSESTFTWLLNKYALKLEYLADDVVIMRKKAKN